MEEFGERLKKLRIENKLSQDELAEKLGVSAQAVSKWERGKSTPDLAVIVPMAKLLRISTDRLLGNEGFRQDWDARWNQAMLAGDPAGAVKIAEEAQQELPEIRHFRYRQAEAEAQLARKTEDPEEKKRLLFAAEQKLRDIVKEYPEFETGTMFFAGVGDVSRLNCDLLIMEEEFATNNHVNQIHNAGKEAIVWTINTEASMYHFLDSVIDGVITDDIELAEMVQKQLDERSDVRILQDKLSGLFLKSKYN